MNLLQALQSHPARIIALAVLAPVTTWAQSGSITTVVESRDQFRPPRQRVLSLGSFGDPSLNDRGDVAFYATVFGRRTTTRNNTIVAMATRGKIKLIAREGEPQRIGRGASFGGNSNNEVTPDNLGRKPVINRSRRISWYAELSETGGSGFLAVSSASGKSVAFVGLSGYDASTLTYGMNSRKRISILGDDFAEDAANSVVRVSGRNLEPLVATGEIPIGLPIDTTFVSFGDPAIANNDELFFTANLDGVGSTFDGIWYGRDGDPTVLVSIFDDAPTAAGTPGNTYSSFGTRPGVGANGETVGFSANVSGTVGYYKASVKSGNVTWVTDSKQSISGPDQVPVKLSGQILANPACNDSGAIAFLATASGGEYDDAEMLFYFTPSGAGTVPIAVGQTLNIGGKEREVVDLRFSNEGGMNDSGQVVFTASFSDRTSGIYIYTP